MVCPLPARYELGQGLRRGEIEHSLPLRSQFEGNDEVRLRILMLPNFVRRSLNACVDDVT